MKSDDSPVALVTGSSAGLGFVIARVLLASGYRVVITGRDAERLEAAAKVLVTGDRDRLLVGVCDVTVPQDVTRLFTSVKQTWQRLDVLVNCVGTSDRGLIENLESNRLED